MQYTRSLSHWLCLTVLVLIRVILVMAPAPSSTAEAYEISFQQGADGYSGTVDTHIMQAEPATGHGGLGSVEWDNNDPQGTSQAKYALIRFDDIFGSGPNQVPLGAVIQSASLIYTVYNSGDPANVNEVSVDWSEAVTWNDFGGDTGVQAGEYGNFVATAYGYSTTTFSIDVTASLSAWAVDPSANRGWIFRPTGGDGVDLRSSEYAVVGDRPELLVDYDESPNLAPYPPALNGPPNDAFDVTTSPMLDVFVSDPEAEEMTVSFRGREITESSAAGFTIVVLPDTQFYSASMFGGSPAIFNAQTQWIVDNRESLNIVYVAHVGDLVQNYDFNNEDEWMAADAAMARLEDPATTGLTEGIPFGVVPGNHDEGIFYDEYFGVDRFCASYPSDCRNYYGGSYPFGSNESNYTIFSAGEMDFIVINLDYREPAFGLLDWADQILKDNPDRRAIVVSHNIIDESGDWDPWGSQIYEALKDNPNLFLMLCGHIHDEARRSDTFNGNTVHTLLADFQERPNGGNGWLRIMEFSPADNEIRVWTYSPWLDQYETDAGSQFVLSYDMSAAFPEIGVNSAVPSDSDTVMEWLGLKPFTEYAWYVAVNDGNQTTTGPVWTFTTSGIAADITGDCDVDGEDLDEYLQGGGAIGLPELAADFGKQGCP